MKTSNQNFISLYTVFLQEARAILRFSKSNLANLTVSLPEIMWLKCFSFGLLLCVLNHQAINFHPHPFLKKTPKMIPTKMIIIQKKRIDRKRRHIKVRKA